jgi:hypothetical protein
MKTKLQQTLKVNVNFWNFDFVFTALNERQIIHFKHKKIKVQYIWFKYEGLLIKIVFIYIGMQYI